jgi:hypothetical protein
MNKHKDIQPQDHHAEVEAPLNSQVQLLRSRVEAELKKPAVVLVTSAHLGDGKTLTADSLARCFAKSGQRAALVNENRFGTGSSDGVAPEPSPQGHVTMLELPPECDNAVSLEGLTAFVDSLRSDYDYAIVDSGAYLKSNSAMALTQLVDGILLTVRVGRPSSDEDEMMVRMVEHFRGNVIGVVATDAGAIDEFERNRPRQEMTAPARPRKVGRKPARALVTSVLCAAMLLMLNGSSDAGTVVTAGPDLGSFQTQVVQVAKWAHDAVTHGQKSPALVAAREQQSALGHRLQRSIASFSSGD